MGIFDFFKEAVTYFKPEKTGGYSAFGRDIAKVPVLGKVLGYTPKSPIEFATAGLGVAVVSTMGVVAGAKAIGTGIVKAVKVVVPKIIPKTFGGKIIGGTAAIIGGGILKESSTAREKVIEVARDFQDKPFELFELGETLGKVIEGEVEPPPLKEAIITGGVVGGLAALGVGALVVVPKIIEKIKDTTKIPEISPGVFEATPEQAAQFQKEKSLGKEETPLLPETTKITTGKKPTRRRRAKKPMSVRQSVKINIINRPIGLKITNRRYLNEHLLA